MSSFIVEKCTCGASFAASGHSMGYVQAAAKEWREQHIHESREGK